MSTKWSYRSRDHICPHGNQQWWQNQTDLGLLHQHHLASNPLGDAFDYPSAFTGLDLEALKADLAALMSDSREWWPAG